MPSSCKAQEPPERQLLETRLRLPDKGSEYVRSPSGASLSGFQAGRSATLVVYACYSASCAQAYACPCQRPTAVRLHLEDLPGWVCHLLGGPTTAHVVMPAIPLVAIHPAPCYGGGRLPVRRHASSTGTSSQTSQSSMKSISSVRACWTRWGDLSCNVVSAWAGVASLLAPLP